jgi:hypothetical protein
MASKLKVDELAGSSSSTIALASGQTLDTSSGTLTLGTGVVTSAMLAGSVANAKLANSSITIGDEGSNVFDISLGDELSIIGGEGVDTSITGNSVTISGEDASTSNKGIASFSGDNFAASSGAITIKDGGVALAEIANAAANTVIVRDANSSGVLSAKAVTNTQILIGDGTGFTAAALSGDVTMTNAGAVTIASQAVENSMLADDAVGADELAANAVVTASIVDANVTTDKIADDAVTAAKLASSAVVTASIVDSNVTNAKIANSFVTIGDESSNVFDINLGDEFSIIGGEGVDTTLTGNLLTVAGEDASTSNKGVASFSSDNFAVSSGAVTIKDAGVALAEIANAAANTVIVRDANSSGVLSAKAVTNTQILIGDGTGFTAAALSGDVTMTNAGAVTIAANAVETAMIADDQVTEAKMADDAISSVQLKSLVTINILASDGSTVVKTIFTPGS